MGLFLFFEFQKLFPFSPTPYFSSAPHFFLKKFPQILKIFTLISVRDAHYFRFQIFPYSSNFCTLFLHLTIIIPLYFKIVNTIVCRLDPNQSEKCKYNHKLVSKFYFQIDFNIIFTNEFSIGNFFPFQRHDIPLCKK